LPAGRDCRSAIADLPLHFVAALLDQARAFGSPTRWCSRCCLSAAGRDPVFRDRGWHVSGALVAALAFHSAARRLPASSTSARSKAWCSCRWRSGCWRARSIARRFSPASAGVFGALIVVGRDQVSLIGCYLLAGFVLWHWFAGAGWQARIIASVKPLAARGGRGRANRNYPGGIDRAACRRFQPPEIGYEFAGRGSPHPANLLMLAFADVFGASDFHRRFWGPRDSLGAAFGQTSCSPRRTSARSTRRAGDCRRAGHWAGARAIVGARICSSRWRRC
jgi:hypothetical protein